MMIHAHTLFLGGFAELTCAVAEFLHCGLRKLASSCPVGRRSGNAHTDKAYIFCSLVNLEHTFFLGISFLEIICAYGIFLGIKRTVGKISKVNSCCIYIIIIESLLVKIVCLHCSGKHTLINCALDCLFHLILGCKPKTLERLHLSIGKTITFRVEDHLVCLLGSLDAESGCVQLADDIHDALVLGIFNHVVTE